MRLSLAERFADLLATDGVVRGLIGPREAPRLWERHLVNCALLGDLIPEGATVCDIGSGAGLPGLVLAVSRPDLSITLVEPLLRRTTFLEEVVSELGLDHVEVVRGRADALHGRRTFQVVTSRAVAPLDRLLGWSMPLVEPSGALVAMKGSSVTEEIESARSVLQDWGCAEPEVRVLGEGLVDRPTFALRVAWADPARVSWPLADETGAGDGSRAVRGRRGRGGSPGKAGKQGRGASGDNTAGRRASGSSGDAAVTRSKESGGEPGKARRTSPGSKRGKTGGSANRGQRDGGSEGRRKA